MKQSIKNKWIKALRSGKYNQGKRYLCRETVLGEQEFCCLGVLVNETTGFDWLPQDPPGFGVGVGVGAVKGYLCTKPESQILPQELIKQLGLTTAQHNTLCIMNDDGYSFNRIATWIKNNVRAT